MARKPTAATFTCNIVVSVLLLLGCWYLVSHFQEKIHYGEAVSGEDKNLAAKTATRPPPLRSSLTPGPIHETIQGRKVVSGEDQDSIAAVTATNACSSVNLNDSQKTLKMDLVIVPYFSYFSDDKLFEREKEYLTVLQRNLKHDLVRCIHVLTTNAEETWQHFKKADLPKNNKLLISEVKSVEMVRDAFEYISQNLVGRDVMFVNADIWLGSGFDRIDPQVMRKQRIMYTLTRHVTEEERCGGTNMCTEDRYIGSHDSFLFHLTEALPKSVLKHLNFRLPSWGMENVLIWLFQNDLKYCTLNPCSILETFHLHCSGLRNHEQRPRVDKGISGRSPFTKSLVCQPSRG